MVMLVMIQVIVLWSVVPYDCRKLMMECIVFTCPFLSLFAGEDGVYERFYLLSSLACASVLWSLLLCRTKEEFVLISLSILCHCRCGRDCRSDYGGGCRSSGISDRRGGGSVSSRAARFAGECVVDGDVDIIIIISTLIYVTK